MQRRYTLGKAHKLCSQTAIDTLFATRREGCLMLAYPLRAVWADSPAGYAQQERVEFLISVPKRKLRHAVDRVKMRRRIREAYRRNHGDIAGSEGTRLQVAFIYVADHLEHYGRVERAMKRILASLPR